MQMEQAMTHGEKVSSFVGDLVEMAKAFEERPELQRQIEHKDKEIERLANANHALEDSNNILRNHIDELNSKILEVTKERDDAGFRVLEAEDKASRVLDLARTLSAGLGQVIAELEPPKPEPVSEPIVSFAASADMTIPPSAQTQPSEVGVGTASDTVLADTSQGQSEPLPTAVSETTQSQDVHSMNVASQENASTDKPYLGKRYSEVVKGGTYPTRDEWYSGGGSQEDWWH